MIAEVCHFYGWTDDHVLSMPAPRFFAMLKASRKLARMERVHDCYVSRAANMDQDGFFQTLQWFDEFGKDESEETVSVVPKKREPLTGSEAKMAVMRAFSKDRSINRKVEH